MIFIVCSAILGLLAIVLVGINWFIAFMAVRAARRRTPYHVSQIHLVPELILLLAVMLWRTQLSLTPFAWVALLVVVADVMSWVVARLSPRPPFQGPRNAL